jgi:hypothetical protein
MIGDRSQQLGGVRPRIVLALFAVVSTLFCAGGAAASDPPATPDASAGIQKLVTLSPEAQLAQADSYVGRAESLRAQVRKDLSSARADRDVVKTLCLNDKLSQLDVTWRSLRERKEALSNAVKSTNQELATHELTILTVLNQRMQELAAEANLCVGKPFIDAENSSTKQFVDPNLPADDPTSYPVPSIVVEPPQCASCYL